MAHAISPTLVAHVAQLAHLPIQDAQVVVLVREFNETLDVIENLHEVDVSTTEPTHQVTGLENAWRDDVVDEERMFTQDEALANAPKKHDGFFVVPRILHNQDE